jgi:hypothetical protein
MAQRVLFWVKNLEDAVSDHEERLAALEDPDEDGDE